MTLRHPTMQELLSPGSRPMEKNVSAARRPVITISRQPGAGGRALADELGQRLSLEVHDRDIIHRIAHQAGLRDSSVTDLEQQDRSTLTEWLVSFATDEHLGPHGYLQHLTRVVEAIAHKGGAVIIGRGAHLILPAGHALRVLVVAPLDARVASVMARHDVGAREAERRIRLEETERGAFLRRYFHADFGDPARFDLVVNTGILGVPGAAEAVQAALKVAPLFAHA